LLKNCWMENMRASLTQIPAGRTQNQFFNVCRMSCAS